MSVCYLGLLQVKCQGSLLNFYFSLQDPRDPYLPVNFLVTTSSPPWLQVPYLLVQVKAPSHPRVSYFIAHCCCQSCVLTQTQWEKKEHLTRLWPSHSRVWASARWMVGPLSEMENTGAERMCWGRYCTESWVYWAHQNIRWRFLCIVVLTHVGLKLKGEVLARETALGVMVYTQMQYKPWEWVPGPRMRIQNGKKRGSRKGLREHQDLNEWTKVKDPGKVTSKDEWRGKRKTQGESEFRRERRGF